MNTIYKTCVGLKADSHGDVAERSKATVCKTVIHRFESDHRLSKADMLNTNTEHLVRSKCSVFFYMLIKSVHKL